MNNSYPHSQTTTKEWEDFARLRETIRDFAHKRGISQDEALCRALRIGLREMENWQGVTPSQEWDDLSDRQRAVLEALRKGLAVKEVADHLNISEVTVRTHIQRIRNRLGCSDLLKLRMM